MKQRIRQLLDHYLSQKASTEEKQIIEDWYENHSADDSLRALSQADKSRIFMDLDARIESFLPHRHFRKRYWLKVAAVFLLCLSGILTIHFNQKSNADDVITYQVIRTPYGTKKAVTLPDQTTVVLNSGSELRIASNFNAAQRNVILSGEAYFSVHHDVTRPFIIRTGRLRTTVLGTAFNIRAYSDERNIQVAVANGRVKVDEQAYQQQFRQLSAGLVHNQVLSYAKISGATRLDSTDTGAILSWTHNQLSFDNAPLNEIARNLERWYNVSVKITGNNCQPDKKYTIHFNNEPLSKILDNLSALTGTNYTINRNQVSINIHNCNVM